MKSRITRILDACRQFLGACRRWLRSRNKRADRWLVSIVLGAMGGVLAVALAGTVHQQVGPLDTTFSARPALGGGTDVQLAPLGSLELSTHGGPVRLQIDVDRLRLVQAQALLQDKAAVERLPDDIDRESHEAVEQLVKKCLLLALIGGGLAGLIRRPHWLTGLVGALSGVAVVAASLGYSAATWRSEALAEPRYTGLLTLAPQAIGDVRDVTQKFAAYRTQLNALVDNVSRLYETTESVAAGPTDSNTIRLLHVSDLHLNPAGFDLTQQMVRQFKPTAVIDTGDINDWGTTFEAASVERIGGLGVPYVFVRGNHDSAETQAAVAAQPNAIVLDGNAADVAGLRIWGIGDPRFTADKELYENRDEERATALAFAPTVRQKILEAGDPPVDVALVHDPSIAADLGGTAPLVLSGHLHRTEQRRLGITTVLVQGSTGGAGLRGVTEAGEAVPLECSILYLDKTTHRLIAYDQVRVEGLGGSGARIERHFVEEAGDGTATTLTTETSLP